MRSTFFQPCVMPFCSKSRFRCQGVIFLAQSNDGYRMIDEPQADHAKDAERPAVASSYHGIYVLRRGPLR
ncbi:hypothetical protein CEXT_597211 [Caerostris extrusa]|uniref:Uncharacterized protein n=1 Tax=Caerostris extrusa TaxID=172846 RepID=A0AAV4Q663_CAEEX|nr:hypothetical protein CEXT_597211 [Caerostris extrusa]